MTTRKIGSWSLLLIALPVFCIFFAQGPAFGGDVRSYVSGHFLLELDGVFAGYLFSAEGGNAVGEVVTQAIGPGNVKKKGLASMKFEDITLNAGANMSKVFYQWISGIAYDKAEMYVENIRFDYASS